MLNFTALVFSSDFFARFFIVFLMACFRTHVTVDAVSLAFGTRVFPSAIADGGKFGLYAQTV